MQIITVWQPSSDCQNRLYHMIKPIPIAGITMLFFFIAGTLPAFSQERPPHALILKNGEVIAYDKVWISPQGVVRCRKGDHEWLYSRDEVDVEKTYGGTIRESGKNEPEDTKKPPSRPSKEEPQYGVGICLGVGKLDGYTKYQIGGKVEGPSGSSYVHFPISELEFPLSVPMVSLEVSTESPGPWKFGAIIKKNIARSAGKAKDSDWGAYYLEGYSWAEQNTLDIYSESDADLNAVTVDINLRYRWYNKSGWSLFAGLRYSYENFDYELSDLDQWYPSSDYYVGEDAGHSCTSGKVGSYNVIYNIPYLEITSMFTINHTITIQGGLGYSPLVHVTDEDHHILRDLVYEGDFYGDAVMIFLDARYNVTEKWFLRIDYKKTALDADGESKAYYRGFIYGHTIEQAIESEQTYTSLSIGYIF